MAAHLAPIIQGKGIAVGLILDDDVTALARQALGQEPYLLHAVGLVIDRTDEGQRGVIQTEHLGQPDLGEVVEEQVSGRSPAIGDQQIVRFRRLEELETAFVDQADELCFGMEALQCRVLVVGVEGTMRDFSVLQVLNKVGREKLFPTPPLPLITRLICLLM